MSEQAATASTHELLNDGIAEIILDNTTLYHGSPIPEIDQLRVGDEGTTLGDGVYFVDNPHDAGGYALRRARSAPGATIYEVLVDNARLVDLDDLPTRQTVLEGYAQHLRTQLLTADNWIQQGRIRRSLDAIKSGIAQAGNIKAAVFNCSDYFTSYVSGLGYDGVKAWEGGEGDEIGPHETYVLFDPAKAAIADTTMLAPKTR